jgi:DNA-nicking Smr family endonuclease
MRKLSDDEQGLWDRLKQSVRPLPRRRPVTKNATAEAKLADQTAPPPPAKRDKKTKQTTAAPSKTAPVAKPSPPSLAPFEEKTLRRLSRGLVGIDDKIDLHGMRQERAHLALGAFLKKSQARGDRIVLVVTGKGQEEGTHERGVLRGAVPLWLARSDLRDLVVGFEEAGRRHGGAGALYVRIRRRREARLRGARA